LFFYQEKLQKVTAPGSSGLKRKPAALGANGNPHILSFCLQSDNFLGEIFAPLKIIGDAVCVCRKKVREKATGLDRPAR
jgi:hypothetical protein